MPVDLAASAVVVAPALLGAVLSHDSPEGLVSLRITEVEAYLGTGEDPGSHAHRGRTPRNSVMFGRPGTLYTYFTYGMHTCANVVCSPEGSASAVLLRAGEVVAGEDLARNRRGEKVSARDLARGPARLVVALGISMADNGADLDHPPFHLELPSVPASGYEETLRTGVSGPGGADPFRWRFALRDEPTVSPYKVHPSLRSVRADRGVQR
ncbi:DNA-3-methyladenine glycosylase [Cnuibacter physcomitrellae]|uniref:DNA-3-methyladenine glycosylase n=1 Tax=Cnuibacter physcomitrellae TaxID=1619308 RepID=UPI002175DE24|nr:DNA-3-methyladenine glycosylase [Cnuibacter physcomitrellae]MCS5499455.1 DNA-3-methyladenine glycosylase [Cnuibacter physcomitrellae]